MRDGENRVDSGTNKSWLKMVEQTGACRSSGVGFGRPVAHMSLTLMYWGLQAPSRGGHKGVWHQDYEYVGTLHGWIHPIHSKYSVRAKQEGPSGAGWIGT